MKKEVLFVMPSLTSGGGERSLVSLLNQIDFEQVQVDLFLLHHEGLFMDLIPREVRLLPLPPDYRLFSQKLGRSLAKLLVQGKGSLAYNRTMFSLKNRKAGNVSRREQYNWKYVASSLSAIPKRYDAAIGFLEKTSIYFCVDKVKAAKKIGWVHTDYDTLGMDPLFDQAYFGKLDHIVTVSEQCASILQSRFPAQRDKVKVIYNIVSPGSIRAMAAREQRDVYHRSKEDIVILSIGRLHEQKGFEISIAACRKLLDRGHRVKWCVIGEGEERPYLTRLIEQNRLTGSFHLLGQQANPYPYIQQADLYVQTSRLEGKSIAIDEAKICQKPIVVTNFSTAKEQIRDGVDGLIAELNAESVSNAIEKLLSDPALKNRLVRNLSGQQLGTEDEIHKFYSLISG